MCKYSLASCIQFWFTHSIQNSVATHGWPLDKWARKNIRTNSNFVLYLSCKNFETEITVN